jgi:hypothetical protein
VSPKVLDPENETKKTKTTYSLAHQCNQIRDTTKECFHKHLKKFFLGEATFKQGSSK